MKQLSRALSPLALSLSFAGALSLFGAAHAASPAHKPAAAKSAAPAAKTAVAASNAIIPLPLNPILPPAQRVCGTKTASGVSFTMLRPATGPVPAEEDYVLVNYIGYLAATGAVFDQGMHATFPVAGVIPGFSQGLQMVPKGGIARFCIPAAMGYGAQAAGPIPANSDLVFQVELVDYKTGAEIETMRKARAAATAPAETAPAAPAPAPTGTPQQ
ncbi:FKBP-type peptidyl-prolyl cis-trans isomerase [Novosphingobium humi]|uniref:Peptidyl-prolyl cis-trans isomerase n=1 Tax=Novosphingobium humi TaxID=2282397 RepID=A0ABY7TRX6_9SPHN|nr:FKBP-type peptidyl-prolyl cis-trans isomerase [Novosphingobium humi]WCT75949.1 FKBP-type peptidyl-prolyl cis-trans isomerase [Novosphingobium humi]